MCFDEKTSLGVFSIGLTSSIILLRNGIANKNKSDILSTKNSEKVVIDRDPISSC